jgi:hypothetical protein
MSSVAIVAIVTHDHTYTCAAIVRCYISLSILSTVRLGLLALRASAAAGRHPKKFVFENSEGRTIRLSNLYYEY